MDAIIPRRGSRLWDQRRDKLHKPDLGERKSVTVCIAAIFQWNYATRTAANLGAAAIVLTDRMITAGDVQYEPQQTKIATVTPNTILMIAGDYSLHSQAVRRTLDRFRNEPTASPESIAIFYGRAIQAIKLKEAEDIYLAPLGLNSDSFLAQQKDMAPHFVSLLTEQMQAYRGEDVEALIVGATNHAVHIYGVDTKGITSCHDDVGFAAIGSGAWHVKSRLMQAGYVNSLRFAQAICFTYAAKKASEMAPGVGQNTDVTLVFKDHIDRFTGDVSSKVHELFLEYKPKVYELSNQYVERFQQFLDEPTLKVADDKQQTLPGGNAQTNERPSTPAAETAQRDESGKATS